MVIPQDSTNYEVNWHIRSILLEAAAPKPLVDSDFKDQEEWDTVYVKEKQEFVYAPISAYSNWQSTFAINSKYENFLRKARNQNLLTFEEVDSGVSELDARFFPKAISGDKKIHAAELATYIAAPDQREDESHEARVARLMQLVDLMREHEIVVPEHYQILEDSKAVQAMASVSKIDPEKSRKTYQDHLVVNLKSARLSQNEKRINKAQEELDYWKSLNVAEQDAIVLHFLTFEHPLVGGLGFYHKIWDPTKFEHLKFSWFDLEVSLQSLRTYCTKNAVAFAAVRSLILNSSGSSETRFAVFNDSFIDKSARSASQGWFGHVSNQIDRIILDNSDRGYGICQPNRANAVFTCETESLADHLNVYWSFGLSAPRARKALVHLEDELQALLESSVKDVKKINDLRNQLAYAHLTRALKVLNQEAPEGLSKSESKSWKKERRKEAAAAFDKAVAFYDDPKDVAKILYAFYFEKVSSRKMQDYVDPQSSLQFFNKKIDQYSKKHRLDFERAHFKSRQFVELYRVNIYDNPKKLGAREFGVSRQRFLKYVEKHYQSTITLVQENLNSNHKDYINYVYSGFKYRLAYVAFHNPKNKTPNEDKIHLDQSIALALKAGQPYQAIYYCLRLPSVENLKKAESILKQVKAEKEKYKESDYLFLEILIKYRQKNFSAAYVLAKSYLESLSPEEKKQESKFLLVASYAAHATENFEDVLSWMTIYYENFSEKDGTKKDKLITNGDFSDERIFAEALAATGRGVGSILTISPSLNHKTYNRFRSIIKNFDFENNDNDLNKNITVACLTFRENPKDAYGLIRSIHNRKLPQALVDFKTKYEVQLQKLHSETLGFRNRFTTALMQGDFESFRIAY